MSGDEDDVHYQANDDAGNDARSLREETAGGRGFNPSAYVRQLRGRGGAQDYLDVKWRLFWLRREHPDAEIVTDHIRIDERIAIFKATVSIPGGGKATGHGSETTGDFPDYIEKAETKALGRALNALGYGAQFAEGDDGEPAAPASTPAPMPSPAPSPVEPRARSEAVVSPPPVSASEPPAAPRGAPAEIAAPTPLTSRVTERRAAPPRPVAAEAVQSTVSRERPAPTPFPGGAAKPASMSAPATDEAEPSLEDYSWTSFWRWAREQGYDSKGGIEAFIGRTMNNLNPLDVRNLILEKRGES